MGPAKAVAMELACRLTDWTQRAVGAYYGGVGSAAVCAARRKLRQCDEETAKTLIRLEEMLSQVTPAEKRVKN